MYRKLGIFCCFLITVNCFPKDPDRIVFGRTTTIKPDGKACSTDTIPNGICIPYYMCDPDTQIIEDGIGIIDIRDKDSEGCDSILEVCCRQSTNSKQCNRPTDTNSGNGMLDNRVRNVQSDKNAVECQDKQSNTDPVISPLTEKIECGFRNMDGIGFIVTGKKSNETHFGEFPWTVAILSVECTKTVEISTLFCGGSLIHPQVVLTSASCASRSERLKVRAGEWDLKSKREIYAHQDRDVVKIIKHSKYNSESLHYDIAILILETSFNKEDNIGVICLTKALEEQPSSDCIATGWGKDQFSNKGTYPSILKLIEMPIVQRRKCQDDLRKTRLGDTYKLHSSYICAGGEAGIDTCQGDGGSPLVCPNKKNPGYYVLSGIVSWGIGCGTAGLPGVYTYIGAMRNWIDKQLDANKIDMSQIVEIV